MNMWELPSPEAVLLNTTYLYVIITSARCPFYRQKNEALKG